MARELKKLAREEMDYLIRCLNQPYTFHPEPQVPRLTEEAQSLNEQDFRANKYPHFTRFENATRSSFIGNMGRALEEVEYWDSSRMQFPIPEISSSIGVAFNPFLFTEVRDKTKCDSQIRLIRLCKTEQTYTPSRIVRPFREISTKLQAESGLPLSSEILGRLAREDLGEIFIYSAEKGFKWWLMGVQETRIPTLKSLIYSVERRPLLFIPGGIFPIQSGAVDKQRELEIKEAIANFTKEYTRTNLLKTKD
jgi:hypothetical protein